MHFCVDELNALLSLIPGIGFLVAWLRGWRHHRKFHRSCDKQK